MRPAALAATLSGRAEERARLLDGVRAGLGGSPRAVLVHGEAGIGKTTLVRSICEEVKLDGAQVLWGQSLRFGAVEAMYHPLVLAMEGWLAEAEDAERASVLEAVPGAALILPSLGASPADSPSGLMVVVDALLSQVITRGPTVLVVDDVQWADPATWDALSYLVAGFGHQRLALVTTHRDEAVGSDGFQRWLGGVRRLPGTEELVLTRLDQDATGDQIAALLGRPPPARLVEQVYDRSRGNPYFSELLVRRGDLGDTELPEDLPDELSQALLDAWRGLSTPAREITRILAIAGRPTDVHTLMSLAAELDVAGTGSVRESVDAGVVVLQREEAWFRHPLLADVLVASYLPGEAAMVHAAWGRSLERPSAGGIDELRRLGDLASHLQMSGADAAAFATLLRAADVAEDLRVRREAADLLARAADLWGTGSPDPGDDVTQARLLERAGRACDRADRTEDAWQMIGRACDLVDPSHDPLWSSTMQILHDELSWHLGLLEDSFTEARSDAVLELTSAHVDSREHADALAWKAENLYWAGQTDQAALVIADALAAAERSGSDAALSHAYALRSMLVLESDLGQADRDAATAWEYALAADDVDMQSLAFMARSWVTLAIGDLDGYVAHAREWQQWDESAGPGRQWPRQFLTGGLLDRGDLVAVDPEVRTGLATSGSVHDEVATRLHAAVLAVRRGALDAARDHLTRAYEIMPFLEERTGLQSGPWLGEVLLALDRPDEALALVQRTLVLNAADPRVVDHLLLWGARAAADLVQRGQDARDQAAARHHRTALERLVEERAGLPGTPFAPTDPRDTMARARDALFVAETGLVHGASDQVARWHTAVAACAEAGMWWEHHGASVRLAAALVETGASREEAARLLRATHAYAVEQQALPLAATVEEVAGLGRIDLSAPVEARSTVPAAFTGLTARETEVLAHLVANRTNAEIAEALFISEKTVSVHVSNLLRKTATGSRREVAALARRVGWGIGG